MALIFCDVTTFNHYRVGRRDLLDLSVKGERESHANTGGSFSNTMPQLVSPASSLGLYTLHRRRKLRPKVF
jgi:hypothetical protein